MHQKILDWGLALLAFAIGLFAFIGVLLFAWHFEDATPWRAMSAAEWGVWVGSIGTIGALGGTIYLATTESRRRRSEQLATARLHSVGMRLRLVHAQLTLDRVAAKLSDATLEDSPHALIKNMLRNFSSIDTWAVTDLLPLTALSDNVAAKLAQAGDEVRVIERTLMHLNERYETIPPQTRISLISSLHPNMRKTSDLIGDALNGIIRAVSDLGMSADR